MTNRPPVLNKEAARRVTDEFRAACQGVAPAEWNMLVLRALYRASVDSVKMKAFGLRTTARFAWGTIRRYRKAGVRRAGSDDLNRIWHFMRGLPPQAAQFYRKLRSIPRENQQAGITEMLLTWITYFASTCNKQLEGGPPDIDIVLTVANPDNFLFYTAVIGLGPELALRFGLEMIREIYPKLPQDHSQAWDDSYNFIRDYTKAPAYIIWAGVGAHFLNEAQIVAPEEGVETITPEESHQIIESASESVQEIIAQSDQDEREEG